VLDFGLVRLRQDRPDAEQVKLTATGVASGTPAYMAPEIVSGDASYDHRVDLYATGCDPARRPGSAGELAGRLAEVPLPKPWTAARSERWWSMHTPEHVRARPVADALLSREGSADPVRELRPRHIGPRLD
jgi:serine/threonine protein kinase